MDHLREFERRGDDTAVPSWLRRVATPLIWREWDRDLSNHPSLEFREYILGGIKNGFRIGFNRRANCRSASRNLHSAVENAAVVREYLAKEVPLGRIVGPIVPSLAPANTQISPFGVIPKPHQPGKWRLIVDLSSPASYSINDGIEPELCSLHYLQAIVQSGCGTLLAKMDVESAYRMVPVHPQDWALLAVQWAGQLFFDTRLPFGLRSAPKVFTAVADALQWSFTRQGVSWVEHYLDDYVTMGPPKSEKCRQNLESMLATCRRLGVPVAPAKCMGPTSVLVFLGFELDTNALVVRLPAEKLRRTQLLVREWMGKKACRRRELESLLGHLQHAATVIHPGRTFVRRLIELVAAFKNRDHWVRLGESTWSDLSWWSTFMEGWNGVSLMPSVEVVPGPLVSDASRSWGCGAHLGTSWFQWKWEGPAVEWDIAAKELLPIILALTVWGKQWAGKRVECLCDNMSVVAVVNAGRTKDKTLMHLLRWMFFIAAIHNVRIQASHLPGASNVAADALSRNRVSQFVQVMPEAEKDPTAIPQPLINLTVREQPNWTSARWARLFSDCCRQA